MPLLFPGDAMHIYQKPDTPTSSPFLKIGIRRLSRWWKKHVFKKQVGVKKGVGKEEETQLQLVPGLCSRKAYNQLLLAWSSSFQQAPSWHTAEQGWAGASPGPGTGFPSRSCSGPDLLLARHKCCHLSAFIKAHQSLCSSESWVTNIIANDLCSSIIALNKVNQDQFNQERRVTKSHLHTDPCISAGKRNTTHVLEQKCVCLQYQKGHSQVE